MRGSPRDLPNGCGRRLAAAAGRWAVGRRSSYRPAAAAQDRAGRTVRLVGGREREPSANSMGGGVETSEPTEGGVDTQEYGVGAAEDTRSAAGEEQKQRRKGAVVQSVLGEEEESAPIKRFQSEKRKTYYVVV